MTIFDEVRKHGYAVRKSLDYVDPKVISYLLNFARKNKRRYVDHKRWLTHGIKFKFKYMKSFHRKFRKSIKGIFIVKRTGLLYSEENCPRQEIHRDREYDNEEYKKDREVLLTSILAVMDNTRIMIRRKEVNLKAGEMVFFRPTTLHCGLEYKEENVRLIQWALKV